MLCRSPPICDQEATQADGNWSNTLDILLKWKPHAVIGRYSMHESSVEEGWYTIFWFFGEKSIEEEKKDFKERAVGEE
jgi:hypothetical protein